MDAVVAEDGKLASGEKETLIRYCFGTREGLWQREIPLVVTHGKSGKESKL